MSLYTTSESSVDEGGFVIDGSSSAADSVVADYFFEGITFFSS